MTEPWARHLDADLIEAYAMGRLPASETARVEEHLLICELCCSKVDETDEFLADLQREARILAGSERVKAASADCKAVG